MAEKTITCEKCRSTVPVSEVKYVPKGKDKQVILCKCCIANLGKEEEKKVVEEKAKMVDYLCIRCNYSFKFDPKAKRALLCPYCGLGDKITEKKKIDVNKML